MFASEVLWRGSMWRVYGKKHQLCGYTVKYVAVNQGWLLVNRVTGQEEELDLEQDRARITWNPLGTSVPMMTSHLSSKLHRDLS